MFQMVAKWRAFKEAQRNSGKMKNTAADFGNTKPAAEGNKSGMPGFGRLSIAVAIVQSNETSRCSLKAPHKYEYTKQR